MSDTLTTTTTGPATDREIVCHIICCDTERTSFCGSPSGPIDRPSGEYPDDCIVCTDLDEQDFCPLYGYGNCTEGTL